MNKTLEGMASVVHAEFDVAIPYGNMSEAYRRGQENVMRAALLWLADNVSDEMSIAAVVDWQNDKGGGTPLQEWLQSAISAALRAAAGGGEK